MEKMAIHCCAVQRIVTKAGYAAQQLHTSDRSDPHSMIYIDLSKQIGLMCATIIMMLPEGVCMARLLWTCLVGFVDSTLAYDLHGR